MQSARGQQGVSEGSARGQRGVSDSVSEMKTEVARLMGAESDRKDAYESDGNKADAFIHYLSTRQPRIMT